MGGGPPRIRLLAASRLGRRYVGYDLDPEYVELARRRVATPLPPTDAHGVALASGKSAIEVASEAITAAGFTITARGYRVPKSGVAVSLRATDSLGQPWFFDVAGPLTAHRDGMSRTEVVWRSLGRANAVKGRAPETPFVVLTSALPTRPSEGDTALRAAGPQAFFDAVSIVDLEDCRRLTAYARTGSSGGAVNGFWTQRELDTRR